MRIVLFLFCFVVSNIFASFNLENQFSTLGSSSIKTESLKQNFLSEPLESLINPDEYTLGPGDGIYLNIVTANQIVNLNLFISPIGDILIPVVGTVFVNGLTINEGFSAIRDKCLDKYNDSNTSITLSKIKDFKIQVLGPFKTMYHFDAINITLGLDYIRVSPDHGPALDLIGKNKSKYLSLLKCLKFIDSLK